MVHQADARDAIDRRGQGGVAELDPGVLDVCLVGLQLRLVLGHHRLLRVQLLLGGELLPREVGEALQVQAGVLQLRLVLRLLRQCLVERGLVWARVDLRQHVSRPDGLALGEADLLQDAVDLGAHRHGVEGLHVADPLQGEGHVGRSHLGHLDWDWCLLRQGLRR